MNDTNRSATRDTVHFLLDLLNSFVAVLLTYIIWQPVFESKGKEILSLLLVFLLLVCFSNTAKCVYDMTVFYYYDRIFKRVTISFLIGTFVLMLLYYFVTDRSVPILVYFTFLGIFYLIMILNLYWFKDLLDRLIRRRNLPRTAYVGSFGAYNKFRYFVGKTTILANEIGFISYEKKETGEGYLGCVTELAEIIRKYNLDQIYFLHKREQDTAELQGYIDLCIEMGVPCKVIVDTYRRRKAHSYISSVGTYPVLTYHTTSMNPYQRVIKRCFDIGVALVGIVLTSPIMLVTAIAIKLDSKGPVLFKQVRVGKNGRHFKIWKFRSMYVDAEERKAEFMSQNEMDGLMFKMKNDPRVTRVGKIIRKLSIDELPQFFNVLFGSMSIVGTRPPTLDEVALYENFQWRRISIKPGITGMWQVSGRSNITSFDEIVRLDLEYIDSWRLLLDLKIFFKTFQALLQHDDAY